MTDCQAVGMTLEPEQTMDVNSKAKQVHNTAISEELVNDKSTAPIVKETSL